MFGITIRTESEAQPFWQLVKRASVFERNSSIEALGYAPHITLARYSDIDPAFLLEAARRLQEVKAFSLTFDRIAFFDTEPIVLWLSPRSNQRLFELQDEIHRTIDPRLCDPHYRPLQWTPHLTIAMAIDITQRDGVLEFANQPLDPVTLSFDAVDCVSWPPVRILNTLSLQPPEFRL
ncbi:2'-5' RNA ligase family protein [Agrobacterium tumefaciens]|uniref:Calmodulin n=1 Tax=Agrobacterium tumefaciens TaxID=358 RepID=A0A2Z2Q1H4_AGRTU|nr:MULTISPECIES: 2'-5' RNA ligase family protein [Agrobacterium]ASK48884.1 calmodulin [Agrobacterium radiobacter]MBO0127926.1 2'-5' RNA ligase family protein [Agrobacterium sp. OT33]MCF1480174.1 2'-5' RNA ligase family protein [Agrobacterium vitis]NTA44640.1 2'-5' RNA ligase family protein [Agrobacterium tumefaciens]NTA48908.1 2'-5' RNA ligase family protein [Agrobacterium tumefaciens]